MASSQVPVTSVVIGEGVSGGALALASPSDLWIAQDGYLAVTAPEHGRVDPQTRCPRHLAGGELAEAYPGRADQPGHRPGHHRTARSRAGIAGQAASPQVVERSADTGAGDGYSARASPISTPHRAPASERSPRSPRWPMRNTRPARQQAGAERHVVVLKNQLAHLVRVVPVRNHDGGERAGVVVRVLAYDLKSPAADRPAGGFRVPGVPGDDRRAGLPRRTWPAPHAARTAG